MKAMMVVTVLTLLTGAGWGADPDMLERAEQRRAARPPKADRMTSIGLFKGGGGGGAYLRPTPRPAPRPVVREVVITNAWTDPTEEDRRRRWGRETLRR